MSKVWVQVRTAAAESSADDKGSPQEEAVPILNTQGYRLPLFLAYSALGAGLTFGAGSYLNGDVALALASGLQAMAVHDNTLCRKMLCV